MSRVLIVDDEPAIVLAVRDELLFEGLAVEFAADGPSGTEAAVRWRPDVLVLDLMLPGMNGFEVCRKLRADLPGLWIILLTARGQEVDRVCGFESGADDYVVKPFSLRELVARVRVGLRRIANPGTQRCYRVGEVELDVPSRTVWRSGSKLALTRKEFELLLLLAQRRGEVIPRDEFCDLIWGNGVFVTPRVVDTHVASLRKKIGDGIGGPAHIVTVHGIGYRLE
jgi:two-component system, OmpR family, alkaline phosphatase synthesis response regulator PhoP